MTIYNINRGIGWASSGVEYAQAYRASILRNIQQDSKFILRICSKVKTLHIIQLILVFKTRK